jgi:hypothetical protein
MTRTFWISTQHKLFFADVTCLLLSAQEMFLCYDVLDFTDASNEDTATYTVQHVKHVAGEQEYLKLFRNGISIN